MIERGAELPVTRQCEILQLSRSSVYYQPVPISPKDFAILSPSWIGLAAWYWPGGCPILSTVLSASMLWRSVKYEDIYLKSYASASELRSGLTEYFKFYNEMRWHKTLTGRPPAMVYFNYSHRQAAA